MADGRRRGRPGRGPEVGHGPLRGARGAESGHRGRDPPGVAEEVPCPAPGPQPRRPGGRRAATARSRAPSRCSPTPGAGRPTIAASSRPPRWSRWPRGASRASTSPPGCASSASPSGRSSTAALRPPPPAEALRGEDLEQATRVSFEESMSGASRRLHLVRHERCPACRGAGDVAFGPVPCPRCGGEGQVRGSRGHMIFSRRCGDCDGHGALSRRRAALRGRGPGLHQRVARGADPAGCGRREPRAAPGGGQRRPPRRRARRLRPHRAGRAAPRLPPRGGRSALLGVHRHDRGGDGRARRGADARRAGDHRGAGRHPARAALPPPQARRAAPRRRRSGGTSGSRCAW